MDQADYVGWVPCINGHLDFGLMKVGIKGGFTDSSSRDLSIVEENFSYSALGDSHERRIVLQSKVNWRDSSKFETDRGFFRVIVTAEVTKSNNMDERSLKGNILIYPIGAEPATIQEREKMNVHNLSHLIKEKVDQHPNFNLLNKICSGLEEITNFDHQYFSCSIGFAIQPSGITKLKYNNGIFDKDAETKYIVARQAFYYLKYSIHTHKHHTTKQDSLTTITPIYKSECDEYKLAGLRLLCQLKRELTALKRLQSINRSLNPTNDAQGIISYVESLIHSFEVEGIFDKALKERELQRFESLKSSFKAQSSKMKNEAANMENNKSKAKVWLGFIIVSCWGAANLFSRGYSNTNPSGIADWIPIFLFVSLSFASVTYVALKIFYQNGTSPEASEHLYKFSKWKIITKLAVSFITAAILIFIVLSIN